MKYNISFKDDTGIGYGIECYSHHDDSKILMIRISEIEAHSIQSDKCIAILKSHVSHLIKSLIAIEKMTKEVH